MTIVNFSGREWDGNMPLKEFAAKLGAENGFRVAGDQFKKNIPLETYEPKDSDKLTAQEIIDLC